MTDTEREALCKRIDELCSEVESWRMVSTSRTKQCAEVNEANDALQAENAKLHDEVERLHAEQAHWELGNCPSCPNVVSLQEALEQNAKLRELVSDLYYETKSPSNHATQVEIRMRELGIEADG